MEIAIERMDKHEDRLRSTPKAPRSDSKRFSKSRRLLNCVAGLCIGMIIVLTIIIVIVTTKQTDAEDKTQESQRIWKCTIAGNNPTKESCEEHGCEFNETNAGSSKPDNHVCNYPTEQFGYIIESIGKDGTIYIRWQNKEMHETQIFRVSVEVKEYSNSMFRLMIKDPEHIRYEVPIPITPTDTFDATNKLYEIKTAAIGEHFWIFVKRKSSNEIIFDTRNTTLVLMDQFLELTALLPSERFYGMAERGAPFRRSMNYVTMPLFAHDNFPSPIGQTINLYSSQPFYMMVENDGSAHGVMIYNSNAMEVYLTPLPSITLRALGGILDMYFFLGPTPVEVTQQLTDVIGKPCMPPYWSIGFHLCRYGYNNLSNTHATFQRNWEKGLPIDVQWQDIDYMDDKLIFTISKEHYQGLEKFVDEELHAKGVHYVIIVDPAVGHREQFDVFERGAFENVYIKNSSDQNIIGYVWPGKTVFPDFTNKKTARWWKGEMTKFHNKLSYDGIWLDMNEPANFDFQGTHGSIYGCLNNTINYPPYKPNTAGDTLFFKTLCLDAKQTWGIQRDLHNIYGYTETIATFDALKGIFPQKRPFIISRSTFLGSGKYGGHWLGDNESNWVHLRQSIIGILDFNMLGIPMTGADIGGFFGDITEELAIRWHQLGAWYPFCRNHNFEGSIDQDPAVFSDDTFQKIKQAIEVRYDLLPYWYTLFHDTHISGKPMIRATFHNFPSDKVLFEKDFDELYTQFMVGENILVAPVVLENVVQTKVYLPAAAIWYKHYSNNYTTYPSGESTFAVPLDELPYFIRGGAIIIKQTSGQTTTVRRNKPYEIAVLPDSEDMATGYIYLDDGLTDNTVTALPDYGILQIKYVKRKMEFTGFAYNNYRINGTIAEIKILNVKEMVTELIIWNKTVQDGFSYNKNTETLLIHSEHLAGVAVGINFDIIIR